MRYAISLNYTHQGTRLHIWASFTPKPYLGCLCTAKLPYRTSISFSLWSRSRQWRTWWRLWFTDCDSSIHDWPNIVSTPWEFIWFDNAIFYWHRPEAGAGERFGYSNNGARTKLKASDHFFIFWVCPPEMGILCILCNGTTVVPWREALGAKAFIARKGNYVNAFLIINTDCIYEWKNLSSTTFEIKF